MTISGRQPSGIYAMNADCYIDCNGKKINDPWSTPHVWLKREALFDGDKTVMADVTANVTTVSLCC